MFFSNPWKFVALCKQRIVYFSIPSWKHEWFILIPKGGCSFDMHCSWWRWPGVHSYSQCILAMEVSTFAWYYMLREVYQANFVSHLWVSFRKASISMRRGPSLGSMIMICISWSFCFLKFISPSFSLNTSVIGLYIFDSKILGFKNCRQRSCMCNTCSWTPTMQQLPSQLAKGQQAWCLKNGLGH